MARRHVGQLKSPAVEKTILADENGDGPLAPQSWEGRIELAAGSGIEDLELLSHGACSRFHLSQRGFCIRSIGRIDEYGHARHSGHQLTQELQSLRRQLNI